MTKILWTDSQFTDSNRFLRILTLLIPIPIFVHKYHTHTDTDFLKNTHIPIPIPIIPIIGPSLSQPQLQRQLNLTSTEVGFDTKMTLHTTHPTQTQLPSQRASDQPLMLLKQQHQH